MSLASLRKRIPPWLPHVAGYGISAACLVWVLNGYPLRRLLPDIASLDWRWVVLAVVADVLVYVVQAWRWNILLEPVARLSLAGTVHAIFVAIFANEVLPLRVGEVLRCYLLAHWNDLRVSVTLASIGVERIMDGLWLLGGFIATAAFVRGLPKDLVLGSKVLGVGLLAGVGVLVWIIFHRQHARSVFRRSRWAATLRHVEEGVALMGNARTMLTVLIISLGYMLLQCFTVYALMKAYGLDFSFWMAFGVCSITRVAIVIPNAPGNVGLLQAACVMALRLFDVERNDATGFSFILWGATTLPLLVLGAIATALTGYDIRELHARAQSSLAEGSADAEEPA